MVNRFLPAAQLFLGFFLQTLFKVTVFPFNWACRATSHELVRFTNKPPGSVRGPATNRIRFEPIPTISPWKAAATQNQFYFIIYTPTFLPSETPNSSQCNSPFLPSVIVKTSRWGRLDWSSETDPESSIEFHGKVGIWMRFVKFSSDILSTVPLWVSYWAT